ncbi:hypothetical protein BGX31_004754 [Mortierella sp. GBA43]|nr:hypothetical protein BGX31_004754 [Mortierella sp. GBA43]
MVFGNTIISSTRGDLSPEQVLRLANFYLDNARNEPDPAVVLVLCYDAEISLSHVKRSKYMDNLTTREGMASVYGGFGDLLETHGHHQPAQAFYRKSEKWGGRTQESDRLPQSSQSGETVPSIKQALTSTPGTAIAIPSSSIMQSRPKRGTDIAKIQGNIFPRNIRPPPIEFKPPEPDTRLDNTPQLVYCLGLLQTIQDPNDLLDPVAQNWLQLVINDTDEQDRLKILATGVIRAFKRDEFKDTKAVTEVVQLAPVLESDDFRHLLQEFFSGIEQSGLLDVHQLEGLALLIQSAEPGQLDADDLVKILKLLSSRLMETHQQSTNHLYQLTLAVSHVLDAMADANVTGLDREKLHEPLLSYLESLKKSSDTYLVYQAAYAFQALLCVPDNESLWKATLRRTGKVIKGVSRLVSAVKGIDLNAFMEGLGDIQEGVAGAMEVIKFAKDTYDDVKSLAEGGKSFMSCLKDGLSFNRKCAWYPALRGVDTLIQEGQFAEFRKLVCEAPCRRDPAFQWGVTQRLGELAASTTWDSDTRKGAIEFLGEVYKNDTEWGSQSTVKQWILNILIQLSTRSGSEMQFADSLLQELRHNGDVKKQALYRSCQEKGPGSHPLMVIMPPLGSPSLLDRVQEKPDVEGHLRLLRRQLLNERGNVVYIPPQAKASLQARDDELFPLMEKVNDFMSGEQKVFLLLGDSGAGKSTFNRELEHTLWKGYKKGGPIPLYISLPAIEKPEHDMIAKQLRKLEFTEPQIREMKTYRRFTLICDGYDESQQTRNLYVSNRLNQTGEWKAKMVISCRSEYVGLDYRDRFQPGDRNQHSGPGLFQEAVMTPFSLDQVQEYIEQYVSVHKPLWEAREYKQALDQIPSLKDLVKNPFLMSLSLEVLPRMVDLGQNLSSTRVTRVSLYDHFIEHWLERNKKRLGEKNLSPQARAAFESLSDEGFTPNGIDFLKKLSVAIYKKQNGQPIVRYSRYKDEDTWKAEFFCRDDEKQLLREACPLTRSGNQHRFIHRSILEYGLALSVFDPQDWKERMAQASMVVRRGSVDSALSFMVRETEEEEAIAAAGQEPDINSPLVWRSYVREPSVLQFLEDRVHQEPVFKQQLLDYIEHSKVDKKWRTAAANAITILVRYGMQFNHADLRDVQIPEADVSYGVFDSAQLQGADLRHVDFRGTWLLQANMTSSRMTGVQFGELPYKEFEDIVWTCAYSPDGKSLSVAPYEGTIHVYSASTWELLLTLDGHEERVNSMMYSPKGSQLVSGSGDGTVRLWDIETGDCLHVLGDHKKDVYSVTYSPSGDHVASASKDQTVKLWSVESGQCIHTLTGHTDYVSYVVYSPKGDRLVSSSYDRTLRVWNIETAECIHVLSGHTRRVLWVVYSPHGDQVASASEDNTMRLWDVSTGESRHTIPVKCKYDPCIMYSPKGDQLASTGRDNTVQLWDPVTGECLHTLRGHSSEVVSITFSPNGELIGSASKDATVRLWDPQTGICRQTLTSDDPSRGIRGIVFSPNGDRVVSSGEDRTVRMWDVGSGSRRVPSSHSNSISSVSCSPMGRRIATASMDMTVRLWDFDTGSCIHTLTDHSGSVDGVAYSIQGDYVASVSNDRTVKLWDAGTGVCCFSFTGHTRDVSCVAFSPCGSQIATGSGDRTIRLWSTETKECCRVLKGHTKRVLKIAYSPRGDVLASTSEDCTVRLWDVTTGDCRHTIEHDEDEEVRPIVCSPNGDQVAYGTSVGSVNLWDMETGTPLQTLTGHSALIQGVAYSPKGDMIVSASADKTVRLWDVVSGRCLSVAEVFREWVYDVDWMETSDGHYLVAGGFGGLLKSWKVISNGDQFQLRLHSRTLRGELAVEGAIIQDALGLSQHNKELLKQRRAVGTPIG